MQLGAGTHSRVQPWVAKLPERTTRITARDGTPDDPILGEVQVRPTDREGSTDDLAELLQSACDASERPIAVTVIAWDGDNNAVARIVVRVKPPKNTDAMPAEPSGDIVKTLMTQNHAFARLLVESQAGMHAGYRDTLAMMSERIVTLEASRHQAEKDAREAMDFADAAMDKARHKPTDTTRDRMMGLLEAAVAGAAPDMLKRVMTALGLGEDEKPDAKPDAKPDDKPAADAAEGEET